jgi:hypothetical protein
MTMSSLGIAFIILALVFGSAVFGLLLGQRLPPHHLSTESKASVSVSMAVIGTMSALVIGFLISNANTSFKARNAAVAQLSSEMIRLDAILRRYGPETESIREGQQRYARMRFDDLFSRGPNGQRNVADQAAAKLQDELQDRILNLKPQDDRQHWLVDQALQLSAQMNVERSLLVQEDANSLPLPFMGAVIIWLSVVFASFGLYAPRNITTVIALFFCAFAVSSALKLVLDLDTPFDGNIHLSPPPIHISSDPLRRAIETINH